MMKKRIDVERLPVWAKSWDFIGLVESKCAYYEVNPYHILALIMLESGGNPLACRYEGKQKIIRDDFGKVIDVRPGFKWTYELKNFAEMLGATEDTIEMLQSTSFGLGQVLGVHYFEKGGVLEPIEHYRWPTALFDENINLEYTLKIWREKLDKYGDDPEITYASYNAGSPRFVGHGLVNQAAVNIFLKYLKEIETRVLF